MPPPEEGTYGPWRGPARRSATLIASNLAPGRPPGPDAAMISSALSVWRLPLTKRRQADRRVRICELHQAALAGLAASSSRTKVRSRRPAKATGAHWCAVTRPGAPIAAAKGKVALGHLSPSWASPWWPCCASMTRRSPRRLRLCKKALLKPFGVQMERAYARLLAGLDQLARGSRRAVSLTAAASRGVPAAGPQDRAHTRNRGKRVRLSGLPRPG
jgi:hypothetical protein